MFYSIHDGGSGQSPSSDECIDGPISVDSMEPIHFCFTCNTKQGKQSRILLQDAREVMTSSGGDTANLDYTEIGCVKPSGYGY